MNATAYDTLFPPLPRRGLRHWAHQEMATADFGDQRLNQRARVLLTNGAS